MKPYFILVSIFLGHIGLGQQSLVFSYDNAGNVIERKITAIFQQRIKFNNSEKSDSLIKTLERNLQVYPNPANDVLNVSGQLPAGLERAELAVYDPTGRLVESRTLTSAGTSIQVQDYSPGIYILEVKLDEDKHVTYKVIITN